MSVYAWDDARVRAALGVRAEGDDGPYAGVSTDTRTLADGDLFVALVGENFDAHDFAADAVEEGARGLVVSRDVDVPDGTPVYRVDDTLVALGALAAHRRAALEARVVGITGSSGKTTTKEMVVAAASAGLRVHATRGNLNNRIGMPHTLLSAPDEADVVVLEMGTNEPGEIRALATVGRPHVGVITTVGASHLEKLGSVEGVLEEKLDILRYLEPGGTCLVGDEPPMLHRAAREVCGTLRVAGWGDDADPDLRPAEAEPAGDGAWSFGWKGSRITLAVPGRHAVTDALLALGVAEVLGVEPGAAARGLDGLAPSKLRGEVRSVGGLTVIVDCYNANPQSVRGALEVLEARPGVRVAVLGTMLELGESARALHGEVLADALERDIDLVVATGGFAEAAAGASGDRVVAASDWKAAWPLLKERLRGDEVILLKASRGVAMEGLLELLEDDFRPDPAAPEDEA